MPITLLSIWQVSELLGHTWQLLGLSRLVGGELADGIGPLLCQSTAGRLRTVYPCLSKLCSDLKEDRCQVSHSLVSPPLRCLVSIPPPSECCFFAASGSLSLLHRVPAGMSLATTGRVAQSREFALESAAARVSCQTDIFFWERGGDQLLGGEGVTSDGN